MPGWVLVNQVVHFVIATTPLVGCDMESLSTGI